jgi:anti-sigma factor RsiW
MILHLRQPLACRQVVELLGDHLEGGLSRRSRRRLEAHLRGCPHCTEYLAQLEATVALTGTLRGEDLSPELRRDLGQVFDRWHQDPSAGPDPGPAA